MRKLTRAVRNSDSDVQSVLQETVQNRMLIKTLESETSMVDRLESMQSILRQRVVKRTAFSVFSNLVLNFGFALGYLVAFLWAAIWLSENTLTFGGMTAFLQLVNRIQNPARNLTTVSYTHLDVYKRQVQGCFPCSRCGVSVVYREQLGEFQVEWGGELDVLPFALHHDYCVA